MDRRKSIKALLIGTASTAALIQSCETNDKKAVGNTSETASTPASNEDDRMAEEKIRNKNLKEEKFFTPEEMLTITILSDIIIPKDEVSGSASDVKVHDFIEFIVKDMPHHQTPMRGGLRWLDLHSLKRFEKSFSDLPPKQRLEIIEDIAYPNKVKAGMQQGVAFFSLLRNLTATGFYTSAIGIKDLGYVGNTPNQWTGVPDEVLKQYNMAYSERELKESISFEA